MTTDAAGAIDVADHSNSVIGKATPAGVVTTVVGTPQAAASAAGSLPAPISSPAGVAMIHRKPEITANNAALKATLVP